MSSFVNIVVLTGMKKCNYSSVFQELVGVYESNETITEMNLTNAKERLIDQILDVYEYSEEDWVIQQHTMKVEKQISTKKIDHISDLCFICSSSALKGVSMYYVIWEYEMKGEGAFVNNKIDDVVKEVEGGLIEAGEDLTKYNIDECCIEVECWEAKKLVCLNIQ